MCLTCGCSNDADVRLVDPVTGQSIPLGVDPAGDHPHQHTDDQGRIYTHTHDLTDLAEPADTAPVERAQKRPAK